MFKVIVVGVDGSDASQRAVRLAAELAKQSGAEIHVLNVPQDETAALIMAGAGGYVPFTPIPPSGDLLEAGRQVAEKAVAVCQELGATRIQQHVRVGAAAQLVLELANEVSADLIVTGRRGLGGIASAMLGSTSHSILNGADCACLSVP